MLIYKKYIAKSLLYPLVTLIFILISLVWIAQILKLLPLIDKGVGLSDFLKMATLLLPSLFFMISPLITVIAAIYVYVKLQDDRQLIALKASGLDNFAIAKPALIIAFVVTLICYYISIHLLPLSYNKLKYSLSNFRENYVSNIITARTFNQLSKYITIYIDKKNPDGTLEGIILFDNKVPESQAVLFAKTGNIFLNDGIPVFQLQNGFRQSFDDQHNLTKLYFDDLLIEIKNNLIDKNERNKTSLELYINEMLWPDKELSEAKKKRRLVDGHQRLIWPFFNYALVFLAVSILLNTHYSRRTNFKQIAYALTPLFVFTYFHFSLQKIAYQEPKYIFGSYLNALLCLILSIWQSQRKRI